MKVKSIKAFPLDFTNKLLSQKIFCSHFADLLTPSMTDDKKQQFSSVVHKVSTVVSHQTLIWENFDVAFYRPLNTSLIRIISFLKKEKKRKLILVILDILPQALNRGKNKIRY